MGAQEYATPWAPLQMAAVPVIVPAAPGAGFTVTEDKKAVFKIKNTL